MLQLTVSTARLVFVSSSPFGRFRAPLDGSRHKPTHSLTSNQHHQLASGARHPEPTREGALLSLSLLPDIVEMTGAIKGTQTPPIRTASPAPLAEDFVRQTVAKQQRTNLHSSSLKTAIPKVMVAHSVNRTALHPSGVQ